MNSLVKIDNKNITFFQGQHLPFFVADEQRFSGATFLGIQSEAALIKTAGGKVEAIAPKSMKLLNDPNADSEISPTAPLRESSGIKFPLIGSGSATVTNIESASDHSGAGSGGRVDVPPPCVINIDRPSDVYIRRDSDGNLSVTICEK